MIGGIGRLFISLGVLLFGFVGYQLYGTGIQTARAQGDLREAFAAALVSTPAAPLPAITTVPGVSASAASGVPTTLAAGKPTPATTVVAPAKASTSVTMPAAAPAILPIPAASTAVASLDIPRIGLKNSIVISGVTVEDLKKGVGHFRNSPLPGQRGNVAFAGHRTTAGHPFGRLDELDIGDQIVFTNTFGEKFVYRMVSEVIVEPTEVGVLAATDTPTLTLVTCEPKYTSTHRLIVKAELDEAASTGIVREPTPPAQGKPAPLPDEAPTTTAAPTTLPPTVAPAVNGSAAPTTVVAATTTAAPTTTTVDLSELSGESDATVEDEAMAGAFAKGWFSDPNAWPHVALWGLACSIIGFAAWRLSRRVDRDLVGFAVGIVPFLVALYFFYENVNRLLPPGL